MKKAKPVKMTKLRPADRDVRRPEPSCEACGYVEPEHEPGCGDAAEMTPRPRE